MIAAETVFVACYALVLLGVAGGLHRLGRANTSPWASRVLAGHRRRTTDVPDPATPADWPHSENGRLHTLVALVAAVAAVTLLIAESVRHHRAAELILLVAVALPATVTAGRLAAAFARHRRHR